MADTYFDNTNTNDKMDIDTDTLSHNFAEKSLNVDTEFSNVKPLLNINTTTSAEVNDNDIDNLNNDEKFKKRISRKIKFEIADVKLDFLFEMNKTIQEINNTINVERSSIINGIVGLLVLTGFAFMCGRFSALTF